MGTLSLPHRLPLSSTTSPPNPKPRLHTNSLSLSSTSPPLPLPLSSGNGGGGTGHVISTGGGGGGDEGGGNGRNGFIILGLISFLLFVWVLVGEICECFRRLRTMGELERESEEYKVYGEMFRNIECVFIDVTELILLLVESYKQIDIGIEADEEDEKRRAEIYAEITKALNQMDTLLGRIANSLKKKDAFNHVTEEKKSVEIYFEIADALNLDRMTNTLRRLQAIRQRIEKNVKLLSLRATLKYSNVDYVYR